MIADVPDAEAKGVCEGVLVGVDGVPGVPDGVLGVIGGVPVGVPGVPGVLVGETGVLDCGLRDPHGVPDVPHAVLGLAGGVAVAVTDVLRGVLCFVYVMVCLGRRTMCVMA